MGCLQALHFGADLVFWVTCTCVTSATILNKIVLVLKAFLNTLVTFNFKKLPDVVGGTFFTTIFALSSLFFIAADFDCLGSIVFIASGLMSFKVFAACFKSFLLA